MDELELLKKDWQSKSSDFESFSDGDIYKMSHNKSSNIVKTLFYISIAELAFWIIVNAMPFVMSEELKSQLGELSQSWVYIGLNIINWGIILLFVYLLWKSHRAISVTDSVKQLMENILKTRKIIKYYVLFNLVVALISVPISIYFSIKQHPELSEVFSTASTGKLALIFFICLVFTGILLGVIWLIYKLIYGILIKRLNQNYRELKKLEV
ncbi:hypothetical protein ACFQ1Q_09755 [Winogradskyella litorisediminis]|uniref:DUF4328 domain-containing protein n=1 Tax=Winogradskyella litorisediminis TaxID=1156618 RepID=A0ABW3N774_9FLAO